MGREREAAGREGKRERRKEREMSQEERDMRRVLPVWLTQL